jgi:branched-chain amino acid transport system substrate-binding protein
VAGRKVELVRGCNELAERTVYVDEARRLVEHEHVDALVGAAPIAAREVARLYPDVPFFATFWEEQETTLRKPAPNLYRLIPDYGQQAAGLGAYAYNELGWRRASVVAGDQPAGWGGAAAFVAEFCALGGKIDSQVLRDLYAGQADAELAAHAVAARSDGVATFLTDADAAPGVIDALLDRIDDPSKQLLLWDQQLPDTLPPRLGSRLDGVALTSRTPAGPAVAALVDYQRRYRAAFPRVPAGFELAPFVVEYADAVEALLSGLERSGGDLSDGRQRLHEELARSRLSLPRGEARLDANRQLVTDVPLVRLRWRGGKTVTEPVSVARGVEQTYGGLLSNAPPPGPLSQPCRKATPPSWAR